MLDQPTFTAYLIDPFALLETPLDPLKLIRAVQFDGSLEGIYAALSHPDMPVDCVDCVRLPTGRDGIYIDDEGLFKGATVGFLIEGNPTPLVGRGLVLGCDEEGNEVAPTVTLLDLCRKVRFWRAAD